MAMLVNIPIPRLLAIATMAAVLLGALALPAWGEDQPNLPRAIKRHLAVVLNPNATTPDWTAAAQALRQAGGRAQGAESALHGFLLATATTGSPHPRRLVVRVFARTQGPQARSWLIALIANDPDETVRVQAIETIFEGDPTWQDGLVDELAAIDPGDSFWTRSALALALARLGQPAPMEAMLQRWADSAYETPEQLLLVRCLALGGRAAVPAFHYALKHPDDAVRSQAAAVLNTTVTMLARQIKRTNGTDPADRAAMTALHDLVASQLATESSQAVLRSYFGVAQYFDDSPAIRRRAITALERDDLNDRRAIYRLMRSRPHPGYVPYISRMLADASDRVRREACQIAAVYDDTETQGHLVAACSDTSPGVRDAAMIALVQRGDPLVIPFYVQALEQANSPSAVADLLNQLGRIGHVAAVPVLLPYLAHDDRTVIRRVVSGLARCGDQSTIALVLPWLDDDATSAAAHRVLQSLTGYKDAAYPTRAAWEALLAGNPTIRSPALGADGF